MPRLNIGDRVRILPTEPTPFANLQAIVRAVRLQDHGLSVLDRYVVVFDWGEEQAFYDVQLDRVP
jgi:hypothetical protein